MKCWSPLNAPKLSVLLVELSEPTEAASPLSSPSLMSPSCRNTEKGFSTTVPKEMFALCNWTLCMDVHSPTEVTPVTSTFLGTRQNLLLCTIMRILMELFWPLRTTRYILQEKFPWKQNNKSFFFSLVWSRWLNIGLIHFFCEFMDLNSVSVHTLTQKKNLANIQPSWPDTWSITHTYFIVNQ